MHLTLGLVRFVLMPSTSRSSFTETFLLIQQGGVADKPLENNLEGIAVQLVK
jgi:hypothetical protein